MKKLNERKFKTLARTRKGDFEVEINVYQIKISGQSFKNELTWKSETLIRINIKSFIGFFDKFKPNQISSFEVAKHFGLNGRINLRCDCNQVVDYIENTDMIRRREFSKEVKKVEEDKRAFNKLHNL